MNMHTHTHMQAEHTHNRALCTEESTGVFASVGEKVKLSHLQQDLVGQNTPAPHISHSIYTQRDSVRDSAQTVHKQCTNRLCKGK